MDRLLPSGPAHRRSRVKLHTDAQILLQSIIMQLPTGTGTICSCSTYALCASLLLLRTELPEQLLILLRLAAALYSASAPSALWDRKTASSAHIRKRMGRKVMQKTTEGKEGEKLSPAYKVALPEL